MGDGRGSGRVCLTWFWYPAVQYAGLLLVCGADAAVTPLVKTDVAMAPGRGARHAGSDGRRRRDRSARPLGAPSVAGAIIGIEILRTRIELLRIDRARRGIIGEMARALLAGIPAERMRSSTARQARALIDANTIHDQNMARRIEQLETAIRQLENSRNRNSTSIAEPAIFDAPN